MKAFRGTLIAGAVLVVVALAAWFLKPRVARLQSGEAPRLFNFEKQELVRVEVDKPDGTTIALKEQQGRWIIEGTDFVAGRSMVNRVKHQLHDLTARATVVTNPKSPELYGLGANAIQVTLTMRDGREIKFAAGDPNPTSVSYYIQPLPGNTIYTVKKSAVDYYSLSLDQFRERRFAGFDSKDCTGITALVKLEDGSTRKLQIERIGDHQWQMHQPVEMSASDDRVRRLLGRVSALKATDFIEVPDAGLDDAKVRYGLADPRADIALSFASRDPIRLLVGDDAPSDNKYEKLAYMLIDGDRTIYVARRGLLEEYREDPSELRNRHVVRMKSDDVVAIDATLKAEGDDDLAGDGSVRYAAGQWVWNDGVPVPGDTPKRVARTLAGMEADAFVDDHPKSLSAYGLDDPTARVVLSDAQGEERVVLIGKEGEPFVDPENNSHPRRYAAIEGSNSVYLVDERVLNVVKDLVRESNRKKKKDAERAKRLERIPTVETHLDGSDAEGDGGASEGGPDPKTVRGTPG